MFGDGSIFAPLQSASGAMTATITCLAILAFLLISSIMNLPLLDMVHLMLRWTMKIFSKFINKREKAYNRDLEIGKITEKRTTYKFYKFLSELIIDLGLKYTGITPYELLTFTTLGTLFVAWIACQILFGNGWMVLIIGPILLVGVFCVLYTKANIAHDTRIEEVIEAENIICNNIKVGVVVAVRDSLDVLPKGIRQDFKDFVDNVEQKNYHIKTALLELNSKLGSVADDFIKKCIVFELEEEHGIAGMFQDIVEINNINMEMRTQMKRKFEEVKFEFITGASMIFLFLAGVLVIFPDVRGFYFNTGIGPVVIAIDVLLLIAEFVIITYLRAQEL